MHIPTRCLLVGLLAFASQSAFAQHAPPATPSGGTTVAMPSAEAEASHNLVIDAGAGRIISLPGGAANIFVADPKVVEVRPASANSLFMFGVGPGRTTVAAMDNAGHPVSQFEVTVRPSAYAASEASMAIARDIPGSNIHVETTPKSLILTGQVRNAETAERAQTLARAYIGNGQVIDNRLTTLSSTQVQLKVRVVEMNRSVTRELGLNFSILGSNATLTNAGSLASAALTSFTYGVGDFSTVLNLLSQDNLVRTLAEPNLVAQSGETASFLAGGEYPIPVSQQNGAISIDYKQYGVQLSFVPTVMSENRISLHVRPEVSDISQANAISLGSGSTASTTTSSNLTIPSLVVRRADTTVELGSGQTFAIGGLLQDNVNHSVNALPFLGDIPVLGALFRSDSFQRNETELVILVTPYIVKPISDPMAINVSKYTAPNDLDRILRLRQLGAHNPVPPTRVSNSGFLVE